MEKNYKGTTYYITKREEGWYNSIQTPTGMVENGFYADEYAADVDAQDTISMMKGETIYNR